MTYRIVCLTWLTVVLGLLALPLMAERSLIPSLESIPDVCSERPNEPSWMEKRRAARRLPACLGPGHLSGTEQRADR